MHNHFVGILISAILVIMLYYAMLYYIIFYCTFFSAFFVMAKAMGVYLKHSFKAPMVLLEVGCISMVVKRQVSD